MTNSEKILSSIKRKINAVAPDATVILYGSYARGEQNEHSDIDVLILLEKSKITAQDKVEVSYPLYDIEFETGLLISPLVLAKKDWETRHRITPFYENVMKDGVRL